MKKLILKVITIVFLFIIFNINEVDSNSDKILYYDSTDIHKEDTFKVYFKNTNIYNLEETLNILNINVLNYIIDDKKYYARDTTNLIKEYTKDKSLEEKIYYDINGIKIDAITIKCEVEELIKLKNLENIY